MSPSTTPPANPLAAFLERHGVLILDGGLATALESRGYDLKDPLWSAKTLLEDPEAICQVHLDFLRAGADCLVTSTYQASREGFRRRGLSDAAGRELIERSVALAVEARRRFWRRSENRSNRLRPLVAASVGPYGAFLADGSEYTGKYGVSDEVLQAFHGERWRLLVESPADLLACETIPSAQEARILLELLGKSPLRWAWMSFSCRDEIHLCDGSRLVEVAAACDAEPRVAAVGINCTAPELIPSLISEVKRGTDKTVIVYPNSGERYDPESGSWNGGLEAIDWGRAAEAWRRAGAGALGGCCRVGPAEILEMRRRLSGPGGSPPTSSEK